MAVDLLKSQPLINADAYPRVINHNRVSALQLKEAVGVITALAAGSVGAIYRFCRIPSNARVSQVQYASAASGATGQVDIGLYQTAANGGAVIDADFFASALDPGGGAITPYTDVTNEAGVGNTIVKSEMPLWEALGLTEDPQRDYDVAATCVEIIANATIMGLKVRYGV